MENLFGPDDDDYLDADNDTNMGYGATAVEIDIESDLAAGVARLPTPPFDLNLGAELHPLSDREPSTIPVANPPDVVDLGIDKEVVIKKKSTRAKFDVERLLSAEGLITIKRRAPRVKFKGKGHEYRYLVRLLECYQVWGHQLFPKANFEDFLAMTERLGRNKQMKVVRRQWIDEWKPVPTQERDSDLDLQQTYNDETGFVVDARSDEDENTNFPPHERPEANSGDAGNYPTSAAVGQSNGDGLSPAVRTRSRSPSSVDGVTTPPQNPTPPRSDGVSDDVNRPTDSAEAQRSPVPSAQQGPLFLFDDDEDDLYD
ncbi:replication fork protection component Swi3-domain-containing protein [Lipomyces kononenkoae]|uniref:Replication fork protection component Swi3-domain-containing protein n=1 Tax=Lipomyces kononenkoae TaxID=34357 RepID=A0ACC3SYY0_LIPKO